MIGDEPLSAGRNQYPSPAVLPNTAAWIRPRRLVRQRPAPPQSAVAAPSRCQAGEASLAAPSRLLGGSLDGLLVRSAKGNYWPNRGPAVPVQVGCNSSISVTDRDLGEAYIGRQGRLMAGPTSHGGIPQHSRRQGDSTSYGGTGATGEGIRWSDGNIIKTFVLNCLKRWDSVIITMRLALWVCLVNISDFFRQSGFGYSRRRAPMYRLLRPIYQLLPR